MKDGMNVNSAETMHRFEKTMGFTVRMALLHLVLSISSISFAAEIPSEGGAYQENYILYDFQEGDSLTALAKKYLGDAQFGLELLAYNELSDPSQLVVGTLLAIPTKIRVEAIKELGKAVEAMNEAEAIDAVFYASDEFNEAKAALAKAQHVRNRAIYDQTIALSKTSQLKSAYALKMAKLNMWQDRSATITSLFNDVRVKNIGERGPGVLVVKNQLVTTNQVVITGVDSRAELTFKFTQHDPSIIQVLENTELEIRECEENPRNKWRHTRLKVLMGDILGEIAPRANDDEETTFDIDAGEAAIAIRGTKLRVNADPEIETMKVSLLETKKDIEVTSADKGTVVNAGEGVLAKDGKPPSPPILLPKAPMARFPKVAHAVIATLQPILSWEAQAGPLPRRYRVELAHDAQFHEILQQEMVEDTSFTTQVLPERKYFWRVSAFEKNGLEGAASEVQAFTIRKNLLFNIDRLPADKVVGIREFARPGYRIGAAPLDPDDTSIIGFEYSADQGQTFDKLSRPVFLAVSDAHEITIRSVSADGSYGEAITIPITVDGTPPVVTPDVVYEGTSGKFDRRAIVSLTGSDAVGVEQIRYSIDGKEYREYEGPFEVGLLTDSEVSFRATDLLGNRSDVKVIHLKGVNAAR